MPMTMAMSSVPTFRRRKDKNCYNKDLSLSENDSYCFRSEHNCYSGNKCFWTKHDCSGSNSISFKMMLTPKRSESREGNNNPNDKLSRHGRRCRYSFFAHGQTKSSIHPFWPTTTKDPNQCASWELDRWCWRRMMHDDGRTQKGFDMIDPKSTRMHARLSYQNSCAVDPSWTLD